MKTKNIEATLAYYSEIIETCEEDLQIKMTLKELDKLKKHILKQADRIAELEHYNLRLATESHQKSERIAQLESVNGLIERLDKLAYTTKNDLILDAAEVIIEQLHKGGE